MPPRVSVLVKTRALVVLVLALKNKPKGRLQRTKNEPSFLWGKVVPSLSFTRRR